MSERPAGPVRRGGAGRTAAGEWITWTVSAGTRGRRWREVAVRDGAVIRNVLLESDPDGRWNHLELATAHGLLTMHPEEDGSTVHGNVVRQGGIEHLARPWSGGHELLVAGSPAALAIVLGRRGAEASLAPEGEGIVAPALAIDDDLTLRSTRVTVRPVGPAAWLVGSGDGLAPRAIMLDADGLVLLDDARDWPLEVDPGA